MKFGVITGHARTSRPPRQDPVCQCPGRWKLHLAVLAVGLSSVLANGPQHAHGWRQIYPADWIAHPPAVLGLTLVASLVLLAIFMVPALLAWLVLRRRR